ncbi:hypothetical protein D5018_12310 [Parashewanella curva]|uniref:AAA+ ATPase domain-containing protein n=1 Tax=Parashewanella curva TaxID=2338552 RepID=A0A3L8PX84_9GAMM|nr:AAA family ATPase [Parashewanella curva]RLV59409.1 hypothetical protein D5018_12310 [Parashewanella curva]
MLGSINQTSITNHFSNNTEPELQVSNPCSEVTTVIFDETETTPLSNIPRSESTATLFSSEVSSERIADTPKLSTKVFPSSSVYTIRDEEDKLTVIDHCRSSIPNATVINILSPLDFNDNGLTEEVCINTDGVITERVGKLYDGRPAILMIDLTVMSPSQVASMNDVLDSPPTLGGNPLGGKITRVILVNKKMLKSGEGNPGEDCWRRLNKFESHHNIATLETLNPKCSVPVLEKCLAASHSLLQASPKNSVHQHAPSPRTTDKSNTISVNPKDQLPQKITIDFSTDEWQMLLYGGLTIDEKGKCYFKKGYLSELEDGTVLIFKNAPWDSKPFIYKLRECLITGHFSANGQLFFLPKDIVIIRDDTSAQQLEALKSQFIDNCNDTSLATPTLQKLSTHLKSWLTERKVPTSVATGIVYLNSSNIDVVLSDIQIKNGKPVFHDTFYELICNKAVLCITSDLSINQWLRLLTRLSQYTTRPKTIILNKRSVLPLPRNHANVIVNCLHFSSQAKSYAQLDKHSLCYRISAKEDWESLWQDLSLESQENFQFKQTQTPLFEALIAGQKITLLGAEKNLKILSQLETLFATPPYLFLHGKRYELPKAQVSVHLVVNPKQIEHLPNLFKFKCEHVRIHGKKNSFKIPWGKNPQAFYQLLEKLPTSVLRTYPAIPPWSALEFTQVFSKQLKIEMEQDHASSCTNYHRRRALHSIIIRAYRGDRNVYNYLKVCTALIYPDKATEKHIDRTRLRMWMAENQPLTKESISKNYWSLVRHCPLTLFRKSVESQWFRKPSESDIHTLLRCLRAAATPTQVEQLNFIASGLTAITAPKTNSILFSQLRDALYVARQRRHFSAPISTHAMDLIPVIEDLIGLFQSHSNEARAKSPYPKMLQGLLSAHIEGLFESDLSDLVEDILLSEQNHLIREKRRLHRLCNRIKNHPIVFLQGVAGAGKSHLAHAVSYQLAKQDSDFAHLNTPLVISLGPETTIEHLYGKQQKLDKESGDSYTKFVEGPVLKWAKDEKPQILILDEANLAKEGVLALLSGLCKDPKQLCYHGVVYPLTNKHRVILTGNPDYYSGRHMDTEISACILTIYCRPLSDKTQARCIVLPSLPTNWNTELRSHTCKLVLETFNKIAPLISEGLSPRDLHEVLTRITFTLSLANCHSPTHEQINAIVFDAFQDTIEAAVLPKSQTALVALKETLLKKYPCDGALLEAKEKKFNAFYQDLVNQNPSLDLRSQPIKNLIRYYWAFIEKRGVSSGFDKHGFIVQGPAGWGKDKLLKAVLDFKDEKGQTKLEYIHINASPEGWEKSLRKIYEAMNEGKTLIISELNLLPSELIEGLFNEVLTSATHPNFLFFATINPPTFEGRAPLSQALTNRCVNVYLEPLSTSELTSILLRKHPNSEEAISWLMKRYEVVSKELLKQKSPFSITLEDLLFIASVLVIHTEDKWPDCFEKKFNLTMQSIDLNKESLETLIKKQFSTRESQPKDTKKQEAEFNEKSAPRKMAQFDRTKKLHPMNSHTQVYSSHSKRHDIAVSPTQAESDIHATDIADTQIQIVEHTEKQITEPEGDPFLTPVESGIHATAIDGTETQKVEQTESPSLTQVESDIHTTAIADTEIQIVEHTEKQITEPEGDPFLTPVESGIHATAIDGTETQKVEQTESPSLTQVESDIHTTAIADTEIQIVEHTEKQITEPEGDPFLTPVESNIHATAIDGDVTSNSQLTIPLYFKNERYSFDYYRIQVNELAIIDGEIGLVSYSHSKEYLEFAEDIETEIPFILGRPFSERPHQELEPDEELGSGRFKLSTSNWTILPTLQTDSVLISLQAREGVELVSARHKISGQWLIKLAPNTQPETQTLTIDFTILQLGLSDQHIQGLEQLSLLDSPCPEEIKRTLDAQIFNLKDQHNKAITKLQEIHALEQPEQQLCELISFFEDFGTSQNITGRNIDILVSSITTKQGTCRHRAWGFHLICQYLGIKTRIVSNDAHAFIEVGVEEESLWRRVDLGGKDATLEFVQSSFIDILPPQNMEKLNTRLQLLKALNDANEPEDAPDVTKAPVLTELSSIQFEAEVDRTEHDITSSEVLANAYIESKAPDDQQYLSALLRILKNKKNIFNFTDRADFLNSCHKSTFFTKNNNLMIRLLPDIFSIWHRNKPEYSAEFPEETARSQKSAAQVISYYLIQIAALYKNNEITDECFLTFNEACLTLFESKLISIGLILPFLEHLSLYSKHKQRAEALLEQFYDSLLCQQVLPENIKTLRSFQDSNTRFCAKSETLEQKLQSTRISSNWKWTHTSSSIPNYPRLARRQPPYLHAEHETSIKPAVLCLPLYSAHECDYIFIHHLKLHNILYRRGRGTPSGHISFMQFYNIRKMIIESYCKYLAKQVISENGFCIITAPCNIKKDRGWLWIKEGQYPMQYDTDTLASLIHRTEVDSILDYASESLQLNTERLEKALKHSSFAIIQQNTFQQGLDEYLANIDWNIIHRELENSRD